MQNRLQLHIQAADQASFSSFSLAAIPHPNLASKLAFSVWARSLLFAMMEESLEALDAVASREKLSITRIPYLDTEVQGIYGRSSVRLKHDGTELHVQGTNTLN
eukprot:749056-Amphidinium_carterae.1